MGQQIQTVQNGNAFLRIGVEWDNSTKLITRIGRQLTGNEGGSAIVTLRVPSLGKERTFVIDPGDQGIRDVSDLEISINDLEVQIVWG